MSKMGISTYQSYCGAQIFDAVGLKSDFVAEYFTGTATRIEGVGLAQIAEETVRRHRDAFGDAPVYTAMRSMSAANINSASAARIMFGPRRRSPPFNMPCAPICPTNTAPTPKSATSSRNGCSPFAACSGSKRRKKTPASRCRSTRWSPRRTSCAGSRPARCRSARFRARPIPRSRSP